MKKKLTIDLNDVVQHPGRTQVYDIETNLSQFDDIELYGKLTGKLTAAGMSGLLMLTGDFSCQVWVECSRCLLRFAMPVAFRVEEPFVIEGTPAGMSHRSFAEIVQDEPFPLFESNTLIVDDLLHQHLALNIPTQPLCRNECKGYCSQCGANLNETECCCAKTIGNPAFAKLAEEWFSKENK